VTADDGDSPTPVDADFVGNLDALSRDLDDVEAFAAAAIAEQSIDQAAARRLANAPTGLTYDELKSHNRQRRDSEGWGEPEIADMLDAVALHELDEWRRGQRIQWCRSDLVVVGIAGLVGALANLYDAQVDATLLKGLAWLKKSDLLRQWEKDAARLPIDYTGPKFGGPAHRVLSPGHDIGRFFNALNQIRTGTFEGTWWEDGKKFTAEGITTTRSGLPFAQASEPHLALVLLMKHWAADFVTPMSLPLPGWTLFREMPNRDLRKFAYSAYAGNHTGNGLNLRSGVFTPGLGMVAAEVIIRTHTHLTAYQQTQTARLSTAGQAKRTEMLLAAHATAGAVSLSKTVATSVASGPAVGVRHLNVPVLLRVGRLAIQVRSDAAKRAVEVTPSWTQLLESDTATWTLPHAAKIAELLEGQQPGRSAEDVE